MARWLRARIAVPALVLALVLSFPISPIGPTSGEPNEPPAIVETALPDGLQDAPYCFNLTAVDPDDLSSALNWTDDSPMFTISPAGEIYFTPDNLDVGPHRFNVTVTDPGGLADTHELSLYIVNVDDPTFIGYIGTQTAFEGQVFTLDLSKYVSDADLLIPQGGPYEHFTYLDDSPLLETDPETGVVTWDRPRVDDVGDLYVRITILDHEGRRCELKIGITVVGCDPGPMIGTIPRQSLVQDVPYSFLVPVNPAFRESGEVLTVSNDRRELFVVDAATGWINFTPSNRQVGVWTVNITVTDQEGASATKRAFFDVRDANDPPTLKVATEHQLVEDKRFELQVQANDPDMEARLLDGSPVNPGERLRFSTNSTLVTIDPLTGIMDFTPTNDDAMLGELRVRITVTDNRSLQAHADVTFRVANVNDPPTNLAIVGVVEGQRLTEGRTYELIGCATDVDDARLTYRWYVNMELLGEGQGIRWKAEGHGPKAINLQVSDDGGSTATFNVTVDLPWVEEGNPSYGICVTLAAIILMALVAFAIAHDRRRG